VRVILAWFMVGLFFSASASKAGNWHTAGSLRCDDCHQQHELNQEGSQPYSYMLVKNSVNELCLSCHDGSSPNAPDVQNPVSMYSGTVSQESGAGFFGLLSIETHMGHALGVNLATPLSGSGQSLSLNCASCHAVHGNGNYRNLLIDPATAGDSIAVRIGDQVMVAILPSDPPTSAGVAAAYERGNTGYVSGLTEWCASCHDRVKYNSTASAPAHFNGHPSSVALNQNSYQRHADPQHWTHGQGDGFVAGGVSGIARIPALSPQATSFTASKNATESDQVTCISCHKPHGSSNKFGMLWPYAEGGATYNAGCQQCHNK
jgi:hypothetical protein